jgi:hypothetical protein
VLLFLSFQTNFKGAIMNRRILPCAVVLGCGIILGGLVGTPGQEAKLPGQSDVFRLANVWSIHLDISAKEYEALQPPAFGKGPIAPEGKRDSEANLFGTQFPWVEGDFTAEGKTLKKVGIRYAGDVTYFSSAQNLKRPLKIDFNKFGPQQFHGLSSVQLHAMPTDPVKGREALA